MFRRSSKEDGLFVFDWALQLHSRCVDRLEIKSVDHKELNHCLAISEASGWSEAL